MAVEGELEDPRPGQPELVAEGGNVGGDYPQILDDEGETTELPLYRGEELSSGTRHPLARLGRRRPGWHVPGGCEGAEMIQSDRVHVGQQGAQSVDAPAIAGPTQRLPVIDGVTPELPLRAEVVRRHAGHEKRPVRLIEQEQIWVGPDIARVGRNEER